MENRRQYYRHTLPPTAGMMVLLRTTDGSSSFFAEMVNLSIGGLCVKSAPRALAPGKRWLASFALMPETLPLNIPVEQIQSQDDRPGYCGFQFLPRAQPREQEEQERLIWCFLLDEQRNERRQARTASRSTAVS